MMTYSKKIYFLSTYQKELNFQENLINFLHPSRKKSRDDKF